MFFVTIKISALIFSSQIPRILLCNSLKESPLFNYVLEIPRTVNGGADDARKRRVFARSVFLVYYSGIKQDNSSYNLLICIQKKILNSCERTFLRTLFRGNCRFTGGCKETLHSPDGHTGRSYGAAADIDIDTDAGSRPRSDFSSRRAHGLASRSVLYDSIARADWGAVRAAGSGRRGPSPKQLLFLFRRLISALLSKASVPVSPRFCSFFTAFYFLATEACSSL